MPLVLFDLRSGKPAFRKQAPTGGVHRVLRGAFDVPDEDRVILVHERDADGFRYRTGCLGIAP